MGNDPGTYVDKRYPASEATAQIIGAAQRVHRELGPGYREKIYQRALALELPARGIEFVREARIPIHYRGREIGVQRVDFVAADVLVEVKAKGEIEAVDVIQALSYLRASRYEIGLLLNFGAERLGIKRLIDSD